jgi:hypothetical protein
MMCSTSYGQEEQGKAGWKQERKDKLKKQVEASSIRDKMDDMIKSREHLVDKTLEANMMMMNKTLEGKMMMMTMMNKTLEAKNLFYGLHLRSRMRRAKQTPQIRTT